MNKVCRLAAVFEGHSTELLKQEDLQYSNKMHSP